MRKILDNKIFKFVYTTIKVCFILIVVAYLSFVVIQRITGNKSIYGYRLFVIASGSMTGVYNIDDVIAVKDIDPIKLKVGDDIAYKGNRGGLENMLITHRIIKIENSDDGYRIFTTKGVNAQIEDPSITGEQILGKVQGRVPVINELNHVVKSQLGFFILIFCPLVLVIVLEVLETITSIKEENLLIRIIDEIKAEDEQLEDVPEIIDVKEDVKDAESEEVIAEKTLKEDNNSDILNDESVELNDDVELEKDSSINDKKDEDNSLYVEDSNEEVKDKQEEKKKSVLSKKDDDEIVEILDELDEKINELKEEK